MNFLKKHKAKLKYLKDKKVITALLVIILLVISTRAAFDAGYDSFVTSVQSQGIKGKIIYVAYNILSVVILTLPIIPVWPIVHSAFGLKEAIFLTYIGMLSGGLINFYLARRFGKPFVKKLLGEKTYQEIDNLIELEDARVFLLLRLLVNNFYDSISYLAGFSDISTKVYILITTLASFIWVLIYFLGIHYSYQFEGPIKFLVMTIGYLALAAVGIYIFKKLKDSKKNKLRQKKVD